MKKNQIITINGKVVNIEFDRDNPFHKGIVYRWEGNHMWATWYDRHAKAYIIPHMDKWGNPKNRYFPTWVMAIKYAIDND